MIKQKMTFNLLGVLLLGGVILYYLMIVPYQNTQALNGIRVNPPSITVDDKRIIDNFKTKPVPQIVPSGKYYSEGEFDGKDYVLIYSFGEDKTVTKEMSILGRYKLSGSAKYHFDGSVLVFTDVVGDRFLFSEIGDAVSVPNEKIIVLHEAARTTSLKSFVMIEQEKKIETNKVSSEGRGYIYYKVIFFMFVLALFIAAHQFYQRKMRGY